VKIATLIFGFIASASVQDPAHHWVFIFPFLGGVAAIWFALQPGPFYPRHHTPESRPTSTRTIRAIYIPAGIVFSAVAGMHFRLPRIPDYPVLRWSVLILLAVIILCRSLTRLFHRSNA